jgi:hypothetical protein
LHAGTSMRKNEWVTSYALRVGFQSAELATNSGDVGAGAEGQPDRGMGSHQHPCMGSHRRSASVPQTVQVARLTCLPVLALCAGCIGPFAPCSGVGNFGVLVTVVDSTTGGPPSSRPSLIITEGAAYADTASGTAPGEASPVLIPAALERPGTYSLTVTAAGYRRWTRDGVRVREGGRCDDIQTVRATARLQADAARP